MELSHTRDRSDKGFIIARHQFYNNVNVSVVGRYHGQQWAWFMASI